MKKEDTVFLNKHLHSSDFKEYTELIKKNGFQEVCYEGSITVKVYDPYLLEMLLTKELPVLNVETKKDTTINGFDYLKTYIQGYSEGREYFDREFSVSPDTFYKNPQYVEDIQHNYFHSKDTKGWEAIKRSHPLLFNHESIKKFGYDCGIVSKVEELKEKRPALFKNFEKCNDNKEVAEKDYDSIKTARVFCLWELFKAGQLEKYYQKRPDGYYRFNRKMFESYIRSKFKLEPKESSATIYAQAIQFINSGRYDFYTKENPKDYNYGLKLFNAMQ